ncbi:MAG: capsid cement protein [Pirellulales bacterium]
MIVPPQLVAGGNINPARFIIQDTTANNTALQAGANGKTIGVSQDGPKDPPGTGGSSLAAAAGEMFSHFTLGQICRMEAGDAITAGDELESDTNGKAVPVAATAATVRYVGAIALEAAGGAGEFLQVLVCRYTKTNPAS